MTQRSIHAGQTPMVVIKAGGDVQVQGWEQERVSANSDSRWGLKVERRRASEVGRVRARVGERVLLDVPINAIGPKNKDEPAEIIQVEIGAGGTVHVPRGSSVKVYAGKSVTISNLDGSVTAYSGWDARLRRVHAVVHASAGGAMDLDCETLAKGGDLAFSAGRDLRFYVRDLTDARISVNDLGGEWEGVIGKGTRKIRLNAGGDAILVTSQEVKSLPPDYVVGNIESPKEDDSPLVPPAEGRQE